jgi:hypothetical protein
MKKALWIVVGGLALLFLAVSTLMLSPDAIWKHPREQRAANQVISVINDYLKRTGDLPEDLEKAGVTEDTRTHFFYERLSGKQFRIWFGTTLGTSMIYDSVSMLWRISD